MKNAIWIDCIVLEVEHHFFKNEALCQTIIKKLSYKDFLNYFNLNNKKTIKCYLTGKTLDLEHDLYEFDHIKSVSNKGSAEIDNLGICCTKANASKSDMDLTEYLDLCKRVLINYGFEVKDPDNLQANIDKILANHRKNE